MYKPSGELYTAAAARSNMAKSNDLKIFLESSLNEIFKATVSDILDSVDRTLSEYQGTIKRIESENEGLKRLLFAQKSKESAARGMAVRTWLIMEGVCVCNGSGHCSFVQPLFFCSSIISTVSKLCP